MSRFFVKTKQFEGPLDLLLHLVKVNEINIFDINILLLTEEYLKYLRLIEFKDLKQAGDFLQMAASLIEIKTRLLLPHEESEDGKDKNLDEIDPIKALQERLIQYETFKNIAAHFDQLPQLGVEVQTNNEWQRLENKHAHIEAPITGNPTTLVVLYELMLRKLSERKHERVNAITHKVSVEEIIEKLEGEILAARFALFQGYYNRFKSRYEFVAYILAMLQLAKDSRLKVYQQEMFGSVWLYRMDCAETQLPIKTTQVKANLEEGIVND